MLSNILFQYFKKLPITLCIFLAQYSIAFGGSPSVVRGTVIDSISSEVLIGATLYEPSTGRGFTTNSYGFFAIPNVTDSVNLQVSYMGYRTQNICLAPSGGLTTIRLVPGATALEGVVVSSKGSRSPTHGQHSLSRVDLRNTPVLMAEKDVLKTIQLLPGIQRNSEGTSNFSVRGGSHDQNLMLIDGIPVYNINHLWGFVSVFNADAVNNVNFFKGGIPASYGGRLSSVVDVMLREGNPDRYTGSVSLGLISNKFTFEGPIQKGQSSFLVAGRRTMYDLVISPIIASQDGIKPGYYFQDYTIKLNHRINPNNTVFLSSYLGNDRLYLEELIENQDDSKYKERFDLGWGNVTTALRWNNSSMPNLFSNVTLAYTYFRYHVSNRYWDIQPDKANSSSAYIGYLSGINDLTTKWDISYYGINNHQLNFGLNHTWHAYNPGVNRESFEGEDFDHDHSAQTGDITYGTEMNAYVEDRFRYGRVSGHLGLRYSLFSVDRRDYHSLQPRAKAEVELTDRLSVYGAYNRMVQHIHLVSNSHLGMPTDLWLPISDWMPPQRADQISAGAKFQFADYYQVTAEVYTKDMHNLTDYADGVVIREGSNDWDNLLTLGEGHSRGVELMLEKKQGTLTGWLSYSISKADRTFSQINNGRTFPFQYDRRHSANLLLTYSITSAKSISASWVASSGHWLTVGYDSYFVGERELQNLNERNNFKLWPHHHLDISYTSSKEKRLGTRNWVIGVYNAYANHNTFLVTRMGPEGRRSDQNSLYSMSIFPIIPFFAWEYIFN